MNFSNELSQSPITAIEVVILKELEKLSSSTIWTAGLDGRIYIREPKEGKIISSFPTPLCSEESNSYISAMYHVNKLSEVWCCLSDGRLFIYDSFDFHLVKIIKYHTSSITDIKPHKDEEYLILSSADFSISMWRTDEHKLVRVFSTKESINCVAVCEKKNWIISGSSSICLWSTTTGECNHTLELPSENQNQIRILDVIVNETHIWASASDCCIYLWDLDTLKLERKCKGHSKSVTNLCNLRNEIWSVSEDNTICIWNSGTFEMTNKMSTSHKHSLLSIKLVAISNVFRLWTVDDTSVRMWDHQCNNFEYGNNLPGTIQKSKKEDSPEFSLLIKQKDREIATLRQLLEYSSKSSQKPLLKQNPEHTNSNHSEFIEEKDYLFNGALESKAKVEKSESIFKLFLLSLIKDIKTALQLHKKDNFEETDIATLKHTLLSIINEKITEIQTKEKSVNTLFKSKEEELNNLTKEKLKQQETIEELQKEKDSLLLLISNQNKKIIELEKDKLELSDEKVGLAERIEKLRKETAEIEKLRSKDNIKSEKKIENVLGELSKSREVILDLQHKLEDQVTLEESAKQEIYFIDNELVKQVEQLQSKSIQLLNKQETLRKDIENQMEYVDKCMGSLDNLNDCSIIIASPEEEFDYSIINELISTKSKLDQELQETFSIISQDKANFNTFVETSTIQIDNMKNILESNDIEERKALYEKELENLKAENQEVLSKVQELKSELKKQEEKIHNLSNQKKVQFNEAILKTKEIEEVRQELIDLKEKLETIESKKKEAESENDKIKEDNGELKKLITDKEQLLLSLTEGQIDLVKSLSEKEKSIEEYRKEREVMKERLLENETMIETFLAQIDQMKKTLEEKNAGDTK
ncbi:hypothetical protein ABK040_002973 [Willaertia magna]